MPQRITLQDGDSNELGTATNPLEVAITGGSIPAPGSDTQVIFNDGGVLGADSGLTYNKTTDSLTITGDLTINGTTTTIDTTNLIVEDKNIVINSGGTTAGSTSAGLDIEGDASAVVGYMRVGSSDNTTFEFSPPGNAFVATLDINATKTITVAGSLNIEADSNINQDLTTDANVEFTQVTVGNTGLVVGTSTPFSDSTGTLTLQNIDALDATTETTIESAIDTLANLTSIQSQTVTLSGSLGVEANSLINQDLTTDATAVQFSTLGVGLTPPISPLHVYENTASVDATAGLTIEQDGAGDAIAQFLLTGGQRFVMGIDNSDSDIFKIARSTDLASSVTFCMNTSGLIGLGEGQTDVGNTNPIVAVDITSAVDTTTPATIEQDLVDNQHGMQLHVAGDSYYTGLPTAKAHISMGFLDSSVADDLGGVGCIVAAESNVGYMPLSIGGIGGFVAIGWVPSSSYPVSGAKFSYSQANDIAFGTNKNERMRILSTGLVGIGINPPISLLHLYEDNASVGQTVGLTIEQDGAGDALAQFIISDAQRWVMGINNSDSDEFHISPTSDLENAVFKIEIGGNVDIGGGRFTSRALSVSQQETLTGNVTDAFNSAFQIIPDFVVTDGGNHTVTRQNYINIASVQEVETSGTITVTDSFLFRFDAAPGTASVLDAGSTKTTPGTVNGWLKCNVNATSYYIPMYTSKTS